MNLDLITAAMQERGLSPEQLANACAVSRPTIERILNGSTVNPGILTMSDIAVHLGLSLDDIMDMPRAQHSGPSRSAELSNLYRAVIHVKDLWIKRLSIACAVLVAWYMVCWLIDFSNPTVGQSQSLKLRRSKPRSPDRDFRRAGRRDPLYFRHAKKEIRQDLSLAGFLDICSIFL